MPAFNSSAVELGNPVNVFNAPETAAASVAGSTLNLNWEPPQRDEARRKGFLHRGMQNINKTAHRSECFKMHGDLFWFDHIHLIPLRLELGTVLTTQERDYELYNAYREQDHVIASIVQSNVDGIVFTGEQNDSPNILRLLNGFVVTVTISPTGPVTINGTVVYTLLTASSTKTLTITGTRVVIMSMEPESEVIESWEWKTDIISAASGDEQRISVRDVPRQEFTYRFVKEDYDLAYFINQLWGWHENTWGVPVWHDYTTLNGDIAAGVTSIPVFDTTKRDFRTGSNELALIWTDKDNFEAVEVTGFTDTSITTTQATLAAHSDGAIVMPLRLAKLPRGWQASNYKTAARELTTRWQILNNIDFEATESPHPIFDGGVYRNLPVWDINSDYLVVSGSYSEGEDKDLRIFGDELGKFSAMTNRDFPQNRVGGVSMQAFGRDEFWRLRMFLHYLRGRQKSIWVSTGREDFRIESTQTTGSAVINVEIVNYTNLIYNAPDGATTRRDIEIVYVDGSKDYRRITVAALSAGLREALTLDSGITQDASIENVERISYLVKRRSTSDNINFTHEFYEGEVVVSGIGLVDINN